MRAFLLLAAVLAMSPAAPLAEPARPAATPAQIESARKEADAIIAAEPGAAQWFENITDSAVPSVRHKPSGLVCTFEPGVRFNSVGLFSGAAPGENASCHTNILGADISFYAARYTARPTLQQSLDSNIASIRTRFPSLQPYDGPGVSIQSPGLPETKRARFKFNSENGEAYTSLTLALVDGWTLKLRVTGPLANATEIQMAEVVTWAANVEQFTSVPGR